MPLSTSRNLSSSRRVLNDTIVNVHSTCQAYKKLVISGIHLLKKIQAGSVIEVHDLECLGEIINELGELIEKVCEYSDQLINLCELNKSPSASVPFVTWTYKDFSDTVAQLKELMKKDLEVKARLVHSSVTCENPPLLDFCLLGWTHFVYTIDESKFEAMLHECRLK